MSEESAPARPALRVVSGSPTPEELAVVAAVVAAVGADAGAAADESVAPVRRGGWNDPAALHRPALIPGPNAWRASLR